MVFKSVAVWVSNIKWAPFPVVVVRTGVDHNNVEIHTRKLSSPRIRSCIVKYLKYLEDNICIIVQLDNKMCLQLTNQKNLIWIKLRLKS